MLFWDHVNEARARILKCLILYIAACAVLYPCAGAILSFLVRPAGELVFLSPPDAFVAYWNVVLWGGVVVSSPYIFFHIWDFVAAGLLPDEKKIVHIYGPVALALFLFGGTFAFFVVLPMSLQFFLGYAAEGIRPLITLDKYVAYVVNVVLAFAVAFELPVLLFMLARLGVVQRAWLIEKRKFAVVAVLIVAAVLTPPDVVSQLMLAVPLVLLYELGIVFAGLVPSENKKPSVRTEGS